MHDPSPISSDTPVLASTHQGNRSWLLEHHQLTEPALAVRWLIKHTFAGPTPSSVTIDPRRPEVKSGLPFTTRPDQPSRPPAGGPSVWRPTEPFGPTTTASASAPPFPYSSPRRAHAALGHRRRPGQPSLATTTPGRLPGHIVFEHDLGVAQPVAHVFARRAAFPMRYRSRNQPRGNQTCSFAPLSPARPWMQPASGDETVKVCPWCTVVGAAEMVGREAKGPVRYNKRRSSRPHCRKGPSPCRPRRQARPRSSPSDRRDPGAHLHFRGARGGT